ILRAWKSSRHPNDCDLFLMLLRPPLSLPGGRPLDMSRPRMSGFQRCRRFRPESLQMRGQPANGVLLKQRKWIKDIAQICIDSLNYFLQRDGIDAVLRKLALL